MKHIFTCLLFVFCSFFTFSQTITFECNNEIITVSFDEITNNPNAYMDWDGDGLINENDYVIYLQDLYNCDDWNFGDEGCYDDAGNFYNIGSELFLDDAGCTYIWCEGVDNWSDIQTLDGCLEDGCWEEGEFYCIGCELFISDCDFLECTNHGWTGPFTLDNEECHDNDPMAILSIGNSQILTWEAKNNKRLNLMQIVPSI